MIAGLALAAAGAMSGAEPAVPGDVDFWDRLVRVFTLADHNTRVVLLGVTLLGVACGVIGSFMLLRKRSLMGDAVSHATLPGIALAFLVMTAAGGDGKFLPGLLLGAFVSGLAGMLVVLWVSHTTRLKQDAALGIVLSVFFGLGVALLGIAQKTTLGHAAGLESFIYGKTASMLASDAAGIAAAAAAICFVCTLLFKEFGLLCFDSEFAGSQGWPVVVLDTLMMGLVVAVTVVGLQAVGLILIIALLVIPPAAARFWTDRLYAMVAIAGGIGATSGLLGAGLSGVVPRMPAGAVVVLVASAFFAISLLLGRSRGLLPRTIDRRRLDRGVARQHVLRALFEWTEEHRDEAEPAPVGVPLEHLRTVRTWSARQLARALGAARKAGLVYQRPDGDLVLTEEGLAEATRVVRNHRLWELYLITHADVAPSHVDRDADKIEHVLGHALVEKLERLLASERPDLRVPPTPHPIRSGALGAARPARSD